MKDRQTLSSILYVSAGVILILAVLLITVDVQPPLYAGSVDIKRPESDLNDNVWSDEMQFKATIGITPLNVHIPGITSTNYNQNGSSSTNLLAQQMGNHPHQSISISGGSIQTSGQTTNTNITMPSYSSPSLMAMSNIKFKKTYSQETGLEEEIIETGERQTVSEESNPNAPVAPLPDSSLPLIIAAILWAGIKTIKTKKTETKNR